MFDKLARIRWEMGQTLLPEHFIVQEESLIADSVFRSRLRGLPDYGVASLKLSETLLAEGVFSIQLLTVVMPSGLLITIPGNAKISSFNLNVPGMVRVPVYLHLLKTILKASDGFKEPEEDGEIPRIIYDLAISSEQVFPDAVETLKMGEFEKDPDGNWRLSKDFIPPLLQVGTSPFLEEELDELPRLLESFQFKLSQEIATSYLSGDSLTGAKLCMKSIYRIRRFIANIVYKVHLHPFYVYDALKEFYNDICFYKNTIPEFVTEPYDPDQLGKCFLRIFQPLTELLKLAQAPSPYLSFELRDNICRILLPPKIREAKEVYFLIQKKHVSDTYSLRDIKLANVARIPMVHKLALKGVPLQKIGRPPFQHTFGPEVDFYRISEGEEWDHALKDLTLGFYNTPNVEDMQYYLYWRFS